MGQCEFWIKRMVLEPGFSPKEMEYMSHGVMIRNFPVSWAPASRDREKLDCLFGGRGIWDVWHYPCSNFLKLKHSPFFRESVFNGFCPMCLRWICSTWRQHVQNRANVEYVKYFRGNLRETKDTVRVSLQEYLFASSSKATSSGFWQKRVRLSDLLEGSLTVLQEPALTVLLVLPKIEGVEKAKHFNASKQGKY